MSPNDRDERRTKRLEAAFKEEQERSLALAARLLLAVLVLVTVWMHIENGIPAAFYFYPFMIGFALLIWMPQWLARTNRGALWHQYATPTLWVSLLLAAVLSSNPLDDLQFPIQFRLQFGNQIYLFLLIAGSAFSYSPPIVMWTGFVCAAAWATATWWVASLPETVRDVGSPRSLEGRDEIFDIVLSPYYVSLGRSVREVIVILVVSWIVAAFVWRARGIVYRQARIEQERTNLSRYFSANLVDELARSDAPLEETRAQEIAVLFADMVGFTRITSEMPAAEVIALLRGFHERTAASVFAHAGTLDKFIGDGVMATFGTPETSTDDALRALRCVHAMKQSVEDWNQERRRLGREAIRIGIGLHYGPVVVGDIGGPQRFEFAVVGDTVNVASRLERLTRELGVDVVVSDTAVEQALRESAAEARPLLDGFERLDERVIRGRKHGIAVWIPRAASERAGGSPSPVVA